MKSNLQHVDIRSTIIPAFFQSPYARAEVIREADEGLRDIELSIITILDQEISPFAIKLKNVAELLGTTEKKMKSHIKAAQRVARDKYDGTYGRPEPVAVEKTIYFMTAMIIAECGRVSDDLDEYTVRFHMDEVFDLAALDTAQDLACWCFLVDYFEHCLKNGKTPITNFMKMHGSSAVSRSKLQSFIKKNDWYGDVEAFGDIFGINIATPTLSDIAKYGLESFEAIQKNVLKRIADAKAEAENEDTEATTE